MFDTKILCDFKLAITNYDKYNPSYVMWRTKPVS